MFIVVVFFLIYGVEVYFKVRGGFLKDTVTTIANNRKTAEDGSGDTNAESQSALFDKEVIDYINYSFIFIVIVINI